MSNELKWIIASTITVVTAAILGCVIWFILALRPVEKDSTEIMTFQLDAGTGVPDVSTKLEEKGLIRSSTAFNVYVTITGKRQQLQAGTYDLSPSLSTNEVATMMSDGKVATNLLVIPEGSTILKIRQLADKKGVNLKDLDAALVAQYDYDFLKARPQGATLEGYLFPDSYELIKPIRTNVVVNQMLQNFAKKLSQTDYVQRYAAQGMTLHQAVTLASIVEREVKSDEDRAMVAQLYLNRLKMGMPLQADPTALYAQEITGKPTNRVDTSINSTYNTYLVKGLPPGPIGNPGLSSLKAVAYPKPNEYLYFISGKDGKTYFAKTYEEHQRNIEKYLN